MENTTPTRIQLIRKYITKSQIGVEIGPFHSPLCPKSEGFNCLVVDAFSREQLLRNYAHDSYVMDRADSIEDVDIVTTQPLGEALKIYSSQPGAKVSSSISCIDYIASSHNFEHQPNPIQFLRDAEAVIKPGGYLVMAIPIASRCFDCFQPLSRTGELIDAFYLQKTKPSIGNAFDHSASSSKLIGGDGINDFTYNFNNIAVNTFNGTLDAEIFDSIKTTAETNYIDSHCWRLNPYLFELIFLDIKACGFVNYLAIEEITTNGSEFIVQIKKTIHNNAKTSLTSHERTDLFKKSLEFQITDLLKGHKMATETVSEITDDLTQHDNNSALNQDRLRVKARNLLRRIVKY